MITYHIDFDSYILDTPSDPYRALWLATVEHALIDWHYLSVCNIEYYDHIKHKELFRFFFLAQDEPNSLTGVCELVDLPGLIKPIQHQVIKQGEQHRNLNYINVVCNEDKLCKRCFKTKPYDMFWSFFYGKIIIEELCFSCSSSNPLRGRWPKEYDINKKVEISAYDILKKERKNDRTISKSCSSC